MTYGLTKGCLLSYTIIWCIEGFEKDLFFCFWGICCCCCFFLFFIFTLSQSFKCSKCSRKCFYLMNKQICRWGYWFPPNSRSQVVKTYIAILTSVCDQLQRLCSLLNITNTSGLVEFRLEPLDCFRFIIGSALIYRPVEK